MPRNSQVCTFHLTWPNSEFIRYGAALGNDILSQLSSVTQSCTTLCDPMDYTVHRILQVRILEWVAFHFSRGSPHPRDQTQVSHIVGGLFTI